MSVLTVWLRMILLTGRLIMSRLVILPQRVTENLRSASRCDKSCGGRGKYHQAMEITITAVSLLGASLSLSTMMIFICYKETPAIKAHNPELSCFLLFSLFSSFLCALTFIGWPAILTRMQRHTAVGVTFALYISCVLGEKKRYISQQINSRKCWSGTAKDYSLVLHCGSDNVMRVVV